MNNVIEVSALSKTFDKNAPYVLKNVNFYVAPGEFINIIGKSGSGKTTLLNLIAGLLRPSEGAVYIDGKNIFETLDSEISTWRNKKIGYVSQAQTLLSTLNVFDNICFPAFLSESANGVENRAEELLYRLQIAHLKNACVKNVSGGELQRIQIAKALINNPKILLADEPTGNLDEENASIVLDILKSIAKNGTAILHVTHNYERIDPDSKILKLENKTLQQIEGGIHV